METNQVILVTGASSGIGEAIAIHLHQKGHIVYGSGRTAHGLHTSGFRFISLNVNDSESVNNAVEYIIQKETRLDVLINNAGIGLAGAVEEVDEESVKHIFDTNITGVYRTCKAVLPQMRRQKSGKIINIGSIAGMIGLPYRSFYSASKFAIEGFSEGLSMEVKQFGIKVVLVQPGDMKTSINQNRIEVDGGQDSPYLESFNYVRSKFSNAVDNAFEPIVIAKIIDQIINDKRPSFRYIKGSFFEYLTCFLKSTLSFRSFEKAVTSYYKMGKIRN